VSADAVLDRVRDIVVPDFRFIDMLSSRLGRGQDRVVFELLLGTGGRRSEVAGMMVGDGDLPAKRVWVRQPVVEVEGRLVRNATPKGGRSRAVMVGPQLAQLLREHLMRMGMPAADAPLLTSATGNGFRWNNYLARRLRPKICSTAVRWAVGERRRLVAEGLSRAQATTEAVASAQKLKHLTAVTRRVKGVGDLRGAVAATAHVDDLGSAHHHGRHELRATSSKRAQPTPFLSA
jgi:integrase